MMSLPARQTLDLVVDQVSGIEAWAKEQSALALAEVVARSREMRLDNQRRLAARRSEQEAVLARAQHAPAGQRVVAGLPCPGAGHRRAPQRRGSAGGSPTR